MRRASLLFSILYTIAINSFAQWESESTGFYYQRRINQIISPTANVVWATAYNAFYIYSPCRDYCKSIDGGNTWNPATIGDAPYGSVWTCIAATDESNAWALFSSGPLSGGTLWKTSDGGTTWSQQGAGTMYSSSNSFPDIIYFWDADSGVVIGDPVNGEFEIYTTSDGGTTWTPTDSANIPDALGGEYGSPGLAESVPVYQDIIWFGTSMGRIFKSIDRGNTWTVLETGLSDAIYPLIFKDENDGWLETYNSANYFDSLYRTSDGGITWTNITPSENFYLYRMCYVPGTENTLVSSGNKPDDFGDFGTSYSPDGGDTWIDIDDSVKHFAVDFFDAVTGWSGGENTNDTTGGIWKFDGNLLTGISEATSSNSFKLYPNPGDGLFYFAFSADNNEPIHITVTNAPGKIVFDQTYKDKSQTWLRSIDLRRFDKGIYFLNIQNNGKSQIQKLVVQ